MASPKDGGPPGETGDGGGDHDVAELAAELAGDPTALKQYIAQRDNEVRELRQRVAALEQFRGLAVDLADSLAGAARKVCQSVN